MAQPCNSVKKRQMKKETKSSSPIQKLHSSTIEEISKKIRETCDNDMLKREKSPEESAQLFHKMALEYLKMSPDKLALIRCVGLLNAAIVRKPTNVEEIKKDLEKVCDEILKKAGSDCSGAILILKAMELKEKIIEMRRNSKDFLKSIKHSPQQMEEEEEKIQLVRRLQREVSRYYQEIMKDVSNFCKRMIQTEFCKYAVVGMGSLAREEVTPYSDFEHVIVLEEGCQDHKDYELILENFRWFSVIFHTIVLNFQETIVPALHIDSLKDWFHDDITPRGISFDGMIPHACKFPLGRQEHTSAKRFETELIKPVSEMLEYLTSEANLKNGYHLKDILMKICFVFGDKDVFQEFRVGIKQHLKSMNEEEIVNETKKEVKEDLENFSTRKVLSQIQSQKEINLKKAFYRSITLFISALGRIHRIFENSSFEMLNSLLNKKVINQHIHHKLSYAVALACEMRLRLCAKNDCQCDMLELRNKDEKSNVIMSLIGKSSAINFFQIMYSLQREVAKSYDLSDKYMYPDPKHINLFIHDALGCSYICDHDFEDIGQCISYLELTTPETMSCFYK